MIYSLPWFSLKQRVTDKAFSEGHSEHEVHSNLEPCPAMSVLLQSSIFVCVFFFCISLWGKSPNVMLITRLISCIRIENRINASAFRDIWARGVIIYLIILQRQCSVLVRRL